jgi:hypothetical membrane protein
MAAGRSRAAPHSTIERAALWAGPSSILVSAVGILTATLLAPSFSSTAHALSALGAAGAETALLFNGPLLVTGLLGVPFALVVFRRRSAPWRRVGTALFGVSMPLLALVGVFALPSPYHAPVAIGFFGAFTLGILVDGIGAYRGGADADGTVSMALASAHVLAWVGWGVLGLAGVALPEMVGTVAIWLWVLRRFREYRP